MSAVTFQALKERLKAEKAQKLSLNNSPSIAVNNPVFSSSSTVITTAEKTTPTNIFEPSSSSSSSSKVSSNHPTSGNSSSPCVPITFRPFLTLSQINKDYTLHGSSTVTAPITTVRYIPEICDSSMENLLTQYIDHYNDRWINLRRRRLQQYGGRPTPQGLLDPEPLPLFLEQCIDEVMKMDIFPPQYRPNHVLINEYLPFQGIFPHTDGPSYYPVVATLSIGGDVIMRYQPRGTSTPISAEVLLQSRSLVITSDEMYTSYMHSIDEVDTEIIGGTGANCINLHLLSPKNNVTYEYYKESDLLVRSPRRISITIRHVPSHRSGTTEETNNGSDETASNEEARPEKETE